MESNDNSKLYDDDLTLLPDIEQYKRQLQALKELTPETTPYEKLWDKYFELAVFFPQMYVIQKIDRFNQHRFFRVRLNIDEKKEDIKLIQTYSFPPSYLCQENGRANLKGRSVFYCSNNPNCALKESKPKVGDIAHISIWKAKATRDIKIAVCLPKDLRVENDFQLMANEVWEYAKKHYENEAKDKFNHLIELNKFIVERFVNETKPYFLTSWLSNQILYNNFIWRDFILYPSIESESSYCNMAFHPNTVIQHLILEKVIRVKITKIENKIITFSIGYVGEIDNTSIRWRKVTEIEDKLFKDYGFSVNEISTK